MRHCHAQLVAAQELPGFSSDLSSKSLNSIDRSQQAILKVEMLTTNAN